MAFGVEFKRGDDGEHRMLFAVKVSGAEYFRSPCERVENVISGLRACRVGALRLPLEPFVDFHAVLPP